MATEPGYFSVRFFKSAAFTSCRATDLGNWPPGRKAKADERARRQQAAKKRNASETETEDEFEAAHSEDSDEEEDYSFDDGPSGTSPEKEFWEREGAGSDRELEEDSEKVRTEQFWRLSTFLC